MALPTPRLVLRDLSPATRLVLAAFLVAVGIGYFSALVQLHFQHASGGNMLPTPEDARRAYAGDKVSMMERLLTAPEDRPFNGHGQMSSAFTTDSAGWAAFLAAHGEKEARALRDAERLALLDWIRSGADRTAYDADRYVPSAQFSAQVKIPEDYLATGPGMSMLERLLMPEKDEMSLVVHPTRGTRALDEMLRTSRRQPFTGHGSMRPAFFERSAGFKGMMKRMTDAEAEKKFLAERNGEAQALIAWARVVKKEDKKTAYEMDAFPLTGELARLQVTENYLTPGEEGRPAQVKIKTLLEDRCIRCHGDGSRNGALDEFELIAAYTEPEEGAKGGEPLSPPQVKIRSLIQDRCVRCHQDAHGADDRARKIPLDSYEHFTAYTKPEQTGGMSLRALAQTTHAHLLSFAVLFALTGLIFSMTSWPGWVRGLFGPMTLVMAVAEIGFWWLSRVNPEATLGILACGGLVGASLGVQILGSLLDMVIGRKSRVNGLTTNGNGNGAGAG